MTPARHPSVSVPPWWAVALVALGWLCLAYLRGGALRDPCSPWSHGAYGDGRTVDTAAIQTAIDQCGTGKEVVFSSGRFVSGTLTLRSGVTLKIAHDATLLASTLMSDYNAEQPHLLFAQDARDVVITGPGTIDGQSRSFFDADLKPLERPSPLIECMGCQNLKILDLRIVNAPGWTIRPRYCNGVVIDHLTLLNDRELINTDGIDPDSSSNVHISNSFIQSGDDCIVLKTTHSPKGGARKAIENIHIWNCTLISSASALKLGTESYMDFRNISFKNCAIQGSRTGIALLAKDGGTMDNVEFEDISVETAPKWGTGVEWPIVIDVEKRNEKSKISTIQNIRFNNITIHTKGRISMMGNADSTLRDIDISNMRIRVTGFEPLEGVTKLRGSDEVSALPPDAVDYGPVPAVFIMAWVYSFRVSNLSIEWPSGDGNTDQRHVMYADHCKNGIVPYFAAGANGAAAFRTENSKSVWSVQSDRIFDDIAKG